MSNDTVTSPRALSATCATSLIRILEPSEPRAWISNVTVMFWLRSFQLLPIQNVECPVIAMSPSVAVKLAVSVRVYQYSSLFSNYVRCSTPFEVRYAVTR